MKNFIAIIILFICTTLIHAQDLTEELVSEQTLITVRVPEGWTQTFIEGGSTYVLLEGDDIILDIYTPSSLLYSRLDEFTDPTELLTEFIALYEWEAGDIQSETVDGRTLTIAEYTIEDFEGILIAVPLADGQFAVLDTYQWDIEVDRDITTAIASTIDIMDAPVTLDGYDGDWRNVITQLEDAELISSGGNLLFVEDRAFFEGQGAFFTPLAENSPQTNFVMSATLDFTPSGDFTTQDELETCNLLSRITLDSQDVAIDFLEVGIDGTGALFYYTAINSDPSQYGEFRRLDPEEPVHVLFIANGDTLTFFFNGDLIASNLPIEERSGSFGIVLRGYGVGASCVGENIWVYSIPRAQTGTCRAVATSTVNKRTEPSTSSSIGGQFLPEQPEDIIMQAIDADGFVWWQLADENWVRNDVVSLLGDCSEVPTGEADL